MLALRANLRLRPILAPLDVIDAATVAIPSIRKVTGVGSHGMDNVALTLVGRVTVDAGFFPVQQLRQHARVVPIGRRGSDRTDDVRSTVDADLRLHAEVPF